MGSRRSAPCSPGLALIRPSIAAALNVLQRGLPAERDAHQVGVDPPGPRIAPPWLGDKVEQWPPPAWVARTPVSLL